MPYLTVNLLSFDFAEARGVIQLDSPSSDEIIEFKNTPYCLVPATDVDTTLRSLQDAGEVAGCPPRQDIIEFLRARKVILDRAMELLERMIGVDKRADLDATESEAGQLLAVYHGRRGA